MPARLISPRAFAEQFRVPPRPPSGSPLEEKCAWLRARVAAKKAERFLKDHERKRISMKGGAQSSQSNRLRTVYLQARSSGRWDVAGRALGEQPDSEGI